MKTMREVIKNQSSQVLREREKEIYQKLLMKQERIKRHMKIVRQIEDCCRGLREEHSIIDRTLFFRERKVTVVRARSGSGSGSKPSVSSLVNKKIEDMSKQEAAVLLEQLLALKHSG